MDFSLPVHVFSHPFHITQWWVVSASSPFLPSPGFQLMRTGAAAAQGAVFSPGKHLLATRPRRSSTLFPPGRVHLCTNKCSSTLRADPHARRGCFFFSFLNITELFQCGFQPLSQKHFGQMFLGHQKEAEEEELLENCSEDEDFH